MINGNEFLNALENIGILAIFDKKDKIKYTSRAFSQILNQNKSDFQDKSIWDIFLDFGVDLQTINEASETTVNEVGWEGVFSPINKSGERIHLNVTLSCCKEENIFFAKDITEFINNKRILQDRLYRDYLTLLPSRFKLLEDKKTFKDEEQLALAIIDIDSFSDINQSFGNDFGDFILKKTAKWLHKTLPQEKCNLYKLDSDIFAALMWGKENLNNYENIVKILTNSIQKEKFIEKENEIDISFSIGIAIGYEKLIDTAFFACKEAKSHKLPYKSIIIDKAFEEERAKNININKILKESTQEDLIIPFFQPIMKTNTLEIEKYEALMRIVPSENEIIMPGVFLPIAKRSKIYPRLTRKLIEKTFEYMVGASREFSINISVEDIANKDTSNFIMEKIRKFDNAPWLVFEILESEGIENYKEVSKFIDSVKSFGSKIAIDDFGTGYSNFEHILRLNVDYLKIDGSLIKNINKNYDNQIIVETIVKFASKLGIKTVAEFVCNEEVFHVVNKLGIDYAQGEYIGMPTKDTILKPNFLQKQ